MEEFATPDVKTIEDLTGEPYEVPAEAQIKTLVFIAEDKPVIALMRGDDEANEAKLAVAFGTTIFRPAEAEEINEALGAHPGSLGAVNVDSIPVYADNQLKEGAGMTTGANKDGFHIRNVNVARDLPQIQFLDLRTVREGELSAENQPLKIRRAIEVGHVFKLGTKYSEALGASFLNEDGKAQAPVMGCYGLGVTRTLQAIIEYSNDDNGIVVRRVATVCITALDVEADGEVMQVATQIHEGEYYIDFWTTANYDQD